MITKWKVFNFKSIHEETELPLAPLTIFAGANSSGKSTFIQSILLVAQTLSHKVSSRSVVLNGAFTSLGQFDDLRSNGSESDQIVIKFTCEPLSERDSSSRIFSSAGRRRPGSIQEVSCEIAFDADPSSSERDLYQIQPRLFASHMTNSFRDRHNVDQKVEIAVVRSTKALSEIKGLNAVEATDELRASLGYDVALDESSLQEVREDALSAEAIGCTFRHFLPDRIIYQTNSIQEEANKITKALKGDNNNDLFGMSFNPDSFLFLPKEVLRVLEDVLREIIELEAAFQEQEQEKQSSVFDPNNAGIIYDGWRKFLRSLPYDERGDIEYKLKTTEDLFDRIYESLKAHNQSSDKYTLIQKAPPTQIMAGIDYLDRFFSTSVKYLGPLRDAPKPLYPLAPTADPNDVGLRGEHTAAVLELHKSKLIKYIPSSNFSAPAVNAKTITRSLETAVVDWLQYLGVATSVKSLDKGKLGHELKVGLGDSESLHDLTHVGVGVSQVLPLLVMCLLAETDSVLVFEQPELHLHPKVQTLLGDFFLSMSLCNKQCIVETHSEYLIDRLRFRIAASPPHNNFKALAKIYFVEKPHESSSFREVVINEYGAITDWPEGFFDQSQHEAEEILRAATLKRKSLSGKKR